MDANLASPFTTPPIAVPISLTVAGEPSSSAARGVVTGIRADALMIALDAEFRPPAAASSGTAIAEYGVERFALQVQITAPASAPGDNGASATGRTQHILRLDTATQPARQACAALLGRLRKDQHIGICAAQDVESSDRFSGFADVNLMPCALPRTGWQALDTRRTFLGRTFSLPIMITGMTGGVEQGRVINHRLAQAAQALDIPMGIGSQRIALEDSQLRAVFAVKDSYPDVFLIGNLGIGQVAGDPERAAAMARQAVEMIDADALALHLNVLQEVIQVEGDREFDNLETSIAAIVEELSIPVLVKEVGGGIDPRSAQRLHELGVQALDVGGRGGTAWGFIEGLRTEAEGVRRAAQTFRDWGIPTAYALAAARRAVPCELVATGGIRDGLTVAKACALGASMVGIGLPLLRAALSSEDAPRRELENLARELRIAMIASGSPDLDALAERLVVGHPCAHDLTHAVTSH